VRVTSVSSALVHEFCFAGDGEELELIDKMTISWFSNNSSGNNALTMNEGGGDPAFAANTTKASPRLSIVDAIKVLQLPKSSRHSLLLEQKEASRFSQLLLEHGERHLQDWAVIAYSSPAKDLMTMSSHHHHHHSSSSGRHKPTKTQWAQAPAPAGGTPSRHHPHGSSSNSKRVHYHHAHHQQQQQQHNMIQEDPEQYPSTHMAKIEGRLHLCSRSIVFEPNDASRSIVRCPFRKLDGAPREYPPPDDNTQKNGLGGRFEAMCIEFKAHRHVIMKEHNTIGPFHTVPIPVEFRFTFLHSSPEAFCDLCQQLVTLWNKQHISNHSFNRNKPSLPSSKDGSNNMTTDSATVNEALSLEELLQPMLERPFDLTHLVDVRERVLTTTSLQASLLTPLQRKPGCVVITTERIYFQPASGALTPTDTKAMHWLVRSVVATACRYSGLRDTALELFFSKPDYAASSSGGTSCSSVLLAFDRKRDREQLLRYLPRSAWSLTDKEFLESVVRAWQGHQISNYDYLLALNAAAGRSFQDLSRYPVFPWVLQDYESSTLEWNNPTKIFRDLSKPVGALNPERLAYFKTRLEGMQDMEDSFLYGTHYSTPGYVLYYLVRSMPEQMLCLQNGTYNITFAYCDEFVWD
jgi:hypothetical protein